MEVAELYCGVGTCLCTEFTPRDDNDQMCTCEHPMDDHNENVDADSD